MSRPFRSLLKWSLPFVATTFALSGCGSGSSGTADLSGAGGGGSVTVEKPVTVTETFSAKAITDPWVSGNPPIHARFLGGTATGNGVWVIPSGTTGVVDFGTPADAVNFKTQDNYTASAGGAAQKPTPQSAAQKETFSVPLFVRGFPAKASDSWDASPDRQMTEVSANVYEVSIALTKTVINLFKIADGTSSWGAVNCGADGLDPATITLGQTYTMACFTSAGGPPNLMFTPPKNANYKFHVDATAGDSTKATLKVTEDTGGGGGGGGGGGTTTPDSTIIKIYAVDVLKPGAVPALYKTVKGFGPQTVAELRQGGDTRITRVEIQNTGTAGDIAVPDLTWTANPKFSPAPKPVSIYYSRASGSVTGTKIRVDGKDYPCATIPTYNGFDCVASAIPVLPYANSVMTVVNADGAETIAFNDGSGSDSIYAFSGSAFARTGTPGAAGAALPALPRNANEVILFYKRDDNVYTDWGLHLWVPSTGDWTNWAGPYKFEGIDPVYGAYFRIVLPGQEAADNKYSANPDPLTTFPDELGFIIHNGDDKDPGPDQFIHIKQDGNIVFVVSGVTDVSSVPPGGGTTLRVSGAAAHLVNASTLLWSPKSNFSTIDLLYSEDASINAGVQGITGTYTEIKDLAETDNPKPENRKLLWGLWAWKLPVIQPPGPQPKDLVRGQLIAIARDADGNAIEGTFVQTAGALDALYADSAESKDLGVTYPSGSSGPPTLAVWAPTAITKAAVIPGRQPGVSVNIYDPSCWKPKSAGGNCDPVESRAMTLDDASGVWSVTGDSSWNWKYYTISLNAYSYLTNSIVTNEVTDPYSVSLSTDGASSQFVDLNSDDPRIKPAGWDNLAIPSLAAPTDSVIYELHVREFSIADPTVPKADQGKFTAFDEPVPTAGMTHLKEMAANGLTHVHIMPAFDFGSVEEDPTLRVELDDKVETLCARNPDAASLCVTDAGKTIRQAMQDAVAANQLDRPQQITGWMRDLDGFNWGYDPVHYGAPEGSYANDPLGAERVLDFRRMVKGLAGIGLRTVMDVVYNHTLAYGQHPLSVLDKVVPGYYYRRDESTGTVLSGSCCSDTASEFRMMQKLMVDTGVRWVRDYKVRGFRFDIMGMHPLAAIQKFQAAVQDTAKGGDPSVYIYGEAWNCCGGENDRRFFAARQANLGGTGIGSFSDRIRDPVRGGGPFDSGDAYVKNQGFVSGAFYDPNSMNSGSSAERDALTAASDNIRLWLAGGGSEYRLTNSAGVEVAGKDIRYSGQRSGYTMNPQEAINYIASHDNETFWDVSQYKHPAGTSLQDRVRADNVGVSVILLGEGIPFLVAGTEILRSKSMDKNSYDSGDWFNEIDWSRVTGKWNVGLPPSWDNSGNYDQIENVILDVNTAPDKAARDAAYTNFLEMLKIRKTAPGSELFRLRSQSEIDQRVKFYNTGPYQIPGLIAMRIDGCKGTALEQDGSFMVVFNATDDPRTLALFGSETWTLHEVQQQSADAVVRTAKHDANGFFVPARTTAVFRGAAGSCLPYDGADLFVRGSINGWADPAPDNYKLQYTGGTKFFLLGPVPAGQQAFKIASKNWEGVYPNCGATVDPQVVVLGAQTQMACGANPPNLNLAANTAEGMYTFSFDAANANSPTLIVNKMDLYIRGSMFDWANPAPSSALMTCQSTGKCGVVLPLSSGTAYNFKVAGNDWNDANATNGGATNCGAGAGGSTVTVGGAPTVMSCDNNSGNLTVTPAAGGNYTFTADFASPTAPTMAVTAGP